MNKVNFRMILIGLIVNLAIGSQMAFACSQISGTYKCNPADAPGIFITTQFVQTSNELSIINISDDGSKNVTDEFEIDGKSHLGAFGISYRAACNDNEPLTIIERTFLLKAVLEYQPTANGLTILRDGNVFETCVKQ
ncbi:MAG: hypothetical protein ACXVLQ_15980 [Bacteriovorax sp.]